MAVDEMIIKFGIDDSNFSGGMTRINKSMALLQSEFKASAEGLKGFGDNTQQLGNKSEYLNKAIELQEQKIKVLQEAYQKSKTEVGEFSNETMAAGTKVNNAVTQLAKLQNQLKEVDTALANESKKVEEEGSAWEKFSEKIKSATSGMGEHIKRGIGMAIGGDIWSKAKEGFSSVINFGGDVQKALNGITAATGLTGEGINGMRQIMTDIYNDNFGENFEDIAQSITMVGQQTGATGEDLKGLTEKALLIRDTFGIEVNESIRSVTMLMKQFGITGDEAFNLIAQGKQKGLDFSDEMLDSVDEYSVQFKKLGLNAQDMFNIFASGAESGSFNLDKVGDSVKEFSIRAVDGSKTTIDGFTQLGFNADEIAGKFAQGGEIAKGAFQEVVSALANMDDPLKQNQLGVELFGTQFEDLGINAIASIGKLNGGISQTTDVLTSMNNVKYNDLGSAFQGIKRNIETGLLLPVGNQLLPKLSEVGNWFASNMANIKSSVSDAITGLSPIFDGIGEGFKLIISNLDTIIPLVIVFGATWGALQIAGIITAAVVAFNTFKTAIIAGQGVMAAFNLVCSANPISLIIIAIGALVGAFVLAYNKIEWFRNGVNAVWEGIKNAFSGVVSWITPYWNNFVVNLKQGFNIFIQFMSTAWDNVKIAFNAVVSFIKPIWDTLWNGIKIVFKAFIMYFEIQWVVIKTIFNVVVSSIKPIWENFVQFLKLAWEGFKIVWNVVCNALKPIVEPIIQGIKILWDNFINGLKILWEGIKIVWEVLCKAFNVIIAPVIEGLKILWNGFIETLKALWEALKTTWNAFCEALKIIITPVIEFIKNAWENFKTGLLIIWEAVKIAWDTICKALAPAIEPVINTIKSLWDKFKAGFDIVVNGIKTAWDTVTNGMKAVWDNIVGGIKSAWEGIKAPFKSVCDWISGIWEGIKSKFKLPHFNISGSLNPLNWESQGTPSIGVEWYAKGGIMTNPTAFGFNGSNVMVGGEAGNEAILPLDSFYATLDSIIDNKLNNLDQQEKSYLNSRSNQGINFDSAINSILDKMDRLEKALDISIDGKSIVKATARDMNKELGKMTKNNNTSKGRSNLAYV